MEKQYVWPSLSSGYMLTVHDSLNMVLFQKRLAERKVYDSGAATETWEHLLLQCQWYNKRNFDEMKIGNGGIMQMNEVLQTR